MNKTPIGRRRIMLCLEGWYYVFVLSFIAGAAILRRANLLLILAALLTAPLIFNWRFVYATLKKLVFSRRVPRYIEAGQLFDVDVLVDNQRSSLDSWCIQIDERITPKNGGSDERVLIAIDNVQCNDSATATYQCLLMERGIYEFGKSVASTSFPFGLVKAYSMVDLSQKVYVAPRLGQLSMQWTNWLALGEVDEPRSIGGKGYEDGAFHAIRDYRSGDSRRAIHWRSTAKLGKPAVKQFERQADQEINLVLDLASVEGESETSEVNATLEANLSTEVNQGAKGVEYCLSFFATIIDQICKAESCELNVLLLGNFFKPFTGSASRSMQYELARAMAEIDIAVLDSAMSELKRYVNSTSLVAPLVVVSMRPAIGEALLTPVHLSGVTIQRFFLSNSKGQNQIVFWLNLMEQNIESLFQLETVSEQDFSSIRTERQTYLTKSGAQP